MKQTEFQEKSVQAKKLLQNSSRVIIFSHEFTDGDDLGSILALARVIERWDKKVVRVAKGGVPDNLLFLPGQSEVVEDLPVDYLTFDLLVTLGCGVMDRTGFSKLSEWTKPILNIDHHSDSTQFGSVNIWNEKAAANCEIVYDLITEWQEEIDKAIAMNLLTGIFTDTGGFRHANVTAKTFEIAAELLRRGANLDLISRFTFSQNDLPKLRAWALAIENARFDPERHMVYTVITDQELRRAEAQEEDLDGVVELLNTIPDAKFSMLLKQRGNEVKGSLRSEPDKGVDVAEIARAFGGGGHKLAAGFKFKGTIEKTQEGWKIT